MNQLNQLNSLRKIRERIDNLEEIGTNPYKRILMEKEKQNLSYFDLSKKLESKGIEIDYQDLRKKLTSGKRYDSQLITTLNEILHLEGEINNNDAVAIYHYIKNRDSNAGKPSKAKKDKRQVLYNDALSRKSDPDNGAYSIDELLLDYANREEEEFIEENDYFNETRILKQILLIYRKYPQVINDLLNDITFDKEDEDIFSHIEIEINE